MKLKWLGQWKMAKEKRDTWTSKMNLNRRDVAESVCMQSWWARPVNFGRLVHVCARLGMQTQTHMFPCSPFSELLRYFVKIIRNWHPANLIRSHSPWFGTWSILHEQDDNYVRWAALIIYSLIHNLQADCACQVLCVLTELRLFIT